MEMLITGYSELPKGITAKINYERLTVSIVIDKKTGLILDFDCSLITELAKKVISSIVIGLNLNQLELIENEILNQYWGSARKSIISGIRECYNKYIQILN